MLRRVRPRSHAFFSNFCPADLFSVRRTNDSRGFSVKERSLRSTTCSAAASTTRLIASARPQLGRDETNSRGGIMKYLLMLIAALALLGTAQATSTAADCCGGGACCFPDSPCCAQ